MEIALEIAILLVGLYLAFFKSYFSEKGKQLAIKEDIQEITTKVETIRSELSLLTKNKFSLHSSEREAILQYHESYSNWRNLVMKISPSAVTSKNYEDKESIKEPLREAQLQQNLAADRVHLFVNESKFIELRRDATVKLMEIQHNIEETIDELSMMYLNLEYVKLKEDDENHLEIQKSAHDKISDRLGEYREKEKKLFKELFPLESKMEHFMREKLFEVIEE